MAINNFVPTVWSESLLQRLDKTYVGVANCNREFEGDIREKGCMVKISGITDITIGDYIKNSDIPNPQQLSDYCSDLEIDQAKYFNFQIDDIDRAQATPHLMDLALKNAADALAATADSYVYSLADEADFTITDAEATPESVINHIIDARTILLTEGVMDPSEIVVEVSPQIAGAILKGKVGLSTDNTESLEKGCIGNIGGCKIFVSPHIATKPMDGEGIMYRCMARTRRAIAFAEQLSDIEAYRPERRFADAMKGLHLYGAKVVYSNELVALNLALAH